MGKRGKKCISPLFFGGKRKSGLEKVIFEEGGDLEGAEGGADSLFPCVILRQVSLDNTHVGFSQTKEAQVKANNKDDECFSPFFKTKNLTSFPPQKKSEAHLNLRRNIARFPKAFKVCSNFWP